MYKTEDSTLQPTAEIKQAEKYLTLTRNANEESQEGISRYMAGWQLGFLFGFFCGTRGSETDERVNEDSGYIYRIIS